MEASSPVALILDERAFRRIIRESAPASAPSPDRRNAETSRPAKNWLTNREAMDYMGWSKMTLQRYRDSGRLPYSKVGSKIFYKLADVERLLESGVVEG